MRDLLPVPDELAEAVRRAAATVPGHPGDLAAVRRRGLVRVRRRRATVAGLAALVVGGGAGTYAVALGPERGGSAPIGPVLAAPSVTATPSPSAIAPAQRMLLRAGGWIFDDKRTQVGVKNEGGLAEVRADGTITRHDVSMLDGVYGAVGLADGSLVLVGYRDLKLGIPADDGPANPNISRELVVLDATGEVRVRRQLPRRDEQAQLVAATETTAYLVRPGGLWSHALATGAESQMLKLAIPSIIKEGGADVAAGYVAVVGADERCQVEVFEPGGTVAARRFRVGAPCVAWTPPRISPDGRSVAVVSTSTRAKGFQRKLTVFDINAGVVRLERILADVDPPDTSRWVDGGVVGMAWLDASTLRVAAVEMPPNPTRVYRIDEVLKLDTFGLGG